MAFALSLLVEQHPMKTRIISKLTPNTDIDVLLEEYSTMEKQWRENGYLYRQMNCREMILLYLEDEE